MKVTEVKLEILEPALQCDPAKTKKIIMSIELDFEATGNRSLNAIRKKGAIYKIGLFVIPTIGDQAKVNEIAYELWSRKRLQEFSNLRIDVREGILITVEAYQQLVKILERRSAALGEEPIPKNKPEPVVQNVAASHNRIPLPTFHYNHLLL